MNTKTLAEKLGVLLKNKRMNLAVAESCTGGLIGGAITEVAGSSGYFLGGVISYDNRIKRDILNVPEKILVKYGAVSSQTVIAMARGAQKLMNADCAIAVSGVAGPGGGTEEKPVGLVYIGIAVKKRSLSFKCQFTGTRSTIREKTIQEGLKRMIEGLGEER